MEDRIVSGLFILAGLFVIAGATGLAIRTFMIPSGAPPLFNRIVFRLSQTVFEAIIRVVRTEARRHTVLSLYAPVSLLLVLATILLLLGIGYTLAFYGLGIKPFIRAFLFSGSALSTIGFESPGNNFWVITFSVVEALTMATVVALLIGYLPGIYSSYQQREQLVEGLTALTGEHPDGEKIIEAYVGSFGATKLGDLWQLWLGWFGDLSRSGSTLSGELYLRSSRWDRSWITAAGAVLDAAALADASLDLQTDPAADRLVHVGSKSLDQVLVPLQLECPSEPTWPETAINVTKSEFNEAFDHFASLGLPMKPDKEMAWVDFARLRVRYQCSLMALVRLKKPPRGSRWTTDREEAKEALALPVFGARRLAAFHGHRGRVDHPASR